SVNLYYGVGSNDFDKGEALTAWMAVPKVFLCPSDGKNGNGYMPWVGPYAGSYPTPNGQAPAWDPPINPATGQPVQVVPVTNYAISWGDNYAGGSLGSNLPWETGVGLENGAQLPPGTPRIGFNGYWGTNWCATCVGSGAKSGVLRGFGDYSTMQIAG